MVTLSSHWQIHLLRFSDKTYITWIHICFLVLWPMEVEVLEPFLHLPQDVWHYLFTFFPVTASVRAPIGLVCKTFRESARPTHLDLEKYKGGPVRVIEDDLFIDIEGQGLEVSCRTLWRVIIKPSHPRCSWSFFLPCGWHEQCSVSLSFLENSSILSFNQLLRHRSGLVKINQPHNTLDVSHLLHNREGRSRFQHFFAILTSKFDDIVYPWKDDEVDQEPCMDLYGPIDVGNNRMLERVKLSGCKSCLLFSSHVP